MTAPIFISHSSRDEKVARTICTALENRGLACWVASRDVGPGENFQEAIVRAIRAAKVMVLVFSENANNSAEVKKELALASAHKLTVIPARVEDVLPSEAFAYELATRQWVNLFENWEDAVERLTAWIIRIVPGVSSDAAAADLPPVVATDTPKPDKTEAVKTKPGKGWQTPGTWSGRPAHGAAAEPISTPSPANKVGVGRALPSSVRTIAVLLIVQGLVRLGLIVFGLVTVGQRVYESSPFVFVKVYVPVIVLGLLAVVAGIVILRRSPIARTFGLVVGTILLVSQLYFLTNTLSVILRASQLNPLFLFNFWVITPFNFLVFAATLICLARWRPQTAPRTDG